MKTTSLFVELIVIGVGGLFAVALVACTVLQSTGILHWFVDRDLGAAVLVLSLSYLLGILVDRVADRSFQTWDLELRTSILGGDEERYYRDRRLLALHGQELWELLEYGRSRLRICRGWAVNSALLLGGLGIHRVFDGPIPDLDRLSLLGLAGALIVLLGIGCVFSWRSLARAEYAKIRRQAEWLRRFM